MKRIIYNILLFSILYLEGFAQNSTNYLMEAKDDTVFILWIKPPDINNAVIIRKVSFDDSTVLSTNSMMQLKLRRDIEEYLGNDCQKICKQLNIKYPEQINDVLDKYKGFSFIFEAVEPKIAVMRGHGFFDGNVTTGESYAYEIIGFDNTGDIKERIITDKIVAIDRPPLSPENLTSKLSKYGVNLFWDDPPGNMHAGFDIFRSEKIDGEYRRINPLRVLKTENMLTDNKSVSDFTDTKVEPGKTYYYKVVSVNILKTKSLPSNIVEVKVPPDTEFELNNNLIFDRYLLP